MRVPRFCPVLASVLLSYFPLLLEGCVGPPTPLSGTFQDISVQEVLRENLTGQRVRWGGTIVALTRGREDTCFDVLSRPLGYSARPRHADDPGGRFIACAHGAYDPAAFTHGRDITVVGTLRGTQREKIGEHTDRYPNVAAEEVYLWPGRQENPPADHVYPDFWYAAWNPGRELYDPWSWN